MRLAVVMVALLLVGPARADPEAESRARAHFEVGQGLYRLGDYQGAIREFAAGYELAHKPGFLLNLGQSYRKLGDYDRARAFYQKFLAEAPPDDPARPQVEKVLREIASLPSRPVPSEPPPEPSPRAPPSSPPAPAAAVPSSEAAAPSVRATAHPHRRALRIAGLTLGVAGLGLLGGGIGAAFAADSAATDLNRLDAMGGTFDPAEDSAYSLDRNLEYALFGAGAAVAATGIVLLLVSLR